MIYIIIFFIWNKYIAKAKRGKDFYITRNIFNNPIKYRHSKPPMYFEKASFID